MLRRAKTKLSASAYTTYRVVLPSTIQNSIVFIHTSAAAEQQNDKPKDKLTAIYINDYVSASKAESHTSQPGRRDSTLRTTSDELLKDVSRTIFRF